MSAERLGVPLIDASSHVCAVVVARIGDTLLVTPALRALRAAAGRLTVLVHPQRVDVLRHLDFIDELGTITKRSAWLRAWLSRGRYDAAFCWGREPALLNYCLRAGRRSVAFDYPEFAGIHSDALLRVAVPAESSLHAVRERALLVGAAGIATDDERLAYAVTDAERAWARDWLAQNLPAGARPFVGLQLFSFPTKAHRDWSVGRFIELARLLCQHYPGAHLIVLGDDHARQRSTPLLEALPGRVSVAAGSLSLRESAALIQQLDVYVGVDTGPTHIAGALGIPMVALYHPRYPGRNLMPLDNPRCTMIEAIEAPDGGMDRVPVEQVWAAVRDRLDGGGA